MFTRAAITTSISTGSHNLDRQSGAPNAPAQPRRAHVPADTTPHLTPGGGSGVFGVILCDELRLALSKARSVLSQ